MSIQLKIFLGIPLNKEMNLHLHQSHAWNEDNITGNRKLLLVTEQNKEYIGQFVPAQLTCSQLKEKEKELKSQLQFYCPKLNLDKQHTYLFPQLFIN